MKLRFEYPLDETTRSSFSFETDDIEVCDIFGGLLISTPDQALLDSLKMRIEISKRPFSVQGNTIIIQSNECDVVYDKF